MANDFQKFEDYFSEVERYYKNGGKLSRKAEEYVQRWETAFAIMQEQRNKAVALKKYQEVMIKSGYVLSDYDVLRDFKNASLIFAPLHVYTKDFLRMVRTEAVMKRMEFLEQKAAEILAEDSKNIQAYERLIKLAQKDDELLIKYNALDVDDPELPNFAKLEMNQININVDKQSSALLQKILKGGAIDLNNFEDGTATETV